MTTTLVVDGYNAINAIPEARRELKKGLRFARKAILAISKEYARSSGYITDVTVVFDGDDKYRHMNTHQIPSGRSQLFSGTGKGDDKVIETVKKYSQSGKVVLASNDNYVRNNSRAYGASLVFVNKLVRKRKRPSSKVLDKKIDSVLQRKITQEYRKKLL